VFFTLLRIGKSALHSGLELKSERSRDRVRVIIAEAGPAWAKIRLPGRSGGGEESIRKADTHVVIDMIAKAGETVVRENRLGLVARGEIPVAQDDIVSIQG